MKLFTVHVYIACCSGILIMNVTEIGTWCGNENTASDEKNLGVNPGDGGKD